MLCDGDVTHEAAPHLVVVVAAVVVVVGLLTEEQALAAAVTSVLTLLEPNRVQITTSARPTVRALLCENF